MSATLFSALEAIDAASRHQQRAANPQDSVWVSASATLTTSAKRAWW